MNAVRPFTINALIFKPITRKYIKSKKGYYKKGIYKRCKAMFTLYWISVPDRASVHTGNAAFKAVSASEQYSTALLRC